MIRQATDIGRGTKGETLGEYSVDYDSLDNSVTPAIKEILNLNRVPLV